MELRKALRIDKSGVVAFTGAGGKTAAMFRLARELVGEAGTVLVTTTTHLGVEQARMGDHLVAAPDPEAIAGALEGRQGVVVITSGVEDAGRAAGIDLRIAKSLIDLAEQRDLPLLIEADGSRMRPLKAPAEHEPVVPDLVDVVVVVAGLSGLGKPVDGEWVHRPDRFRALAGLAEGERVTPGALAAVLGSPDGGLRGVPPGARRIALLNQADTPELQAQGGRIAGGISGAFVAAVVASLERREVYAVHEKAAGIVLAAGGSTRMGRSKQLLDWGGRPLVAHVAGVALAAGCDPVIVVTGAEAEAVWDAVAGLPVRVVNNPDWAEGQSTSVRAGLAAVGGAGSALFFLVDQPFVEPTMVRKLIETHASTLAPIVAPMIGDRRGNPVLFDRDTFPDFEGIEGDSGGRQLFSRYPIEWVAWHEERALRDLDSIEDYREAGRDV